MKIARRKQKRQTNKTKQKHKINAPHRNQNKRRHNNSSPDSGRLHNISYIYFRENNNQMMLVFSCIRTKNIKKREN